MSEGQGHGLKFTVTGGKGSVRPLVKTLHPKNETDTLKSLLFYFIYILHTKTIATVKRLFAFAVQWGWIDFGSWPMGCICEILTRGSQFGTRTDHTGKGIPYPSGGSRAVFENTLTPRSD